MTLSLLTSGYEYNLLAQINRCRVALGLPEHGVGTSFNLFDQINQLRFILGLPLVGAGSPSDLIKEINDLIAPINAFGGGSGYHADAVHFDAAPTFLTNNSLVAANSKLYSHVRWFKRQQSGNTGISGAVYVVDPDDTVVPVDNLSRATATGNGTFTIGVELAAGAPVFEGVTASFPNLVWYCEIFSFDGTGSGTPAKYKLYVNDVDTAFSGGLTNQNGPYSNIAGNGEVAQIGFDNGDATGAFLGDMADFRIWYGVSLLDGTGDIPVATRRLFIDTNGKPVDPAIATAQFGAGTIFFSGDASAFGMNKGTGGVFTTTGTLTNASTSPSD